MGWWTIRQRPELENRVELLAFLTLMTAALPFAPEVTAVGMTLFMLAVIQTGWSRVVAKAT